MFKRKTIVTHSGAFHADDVFAVATLDLTYDGKVKFMRSREPEDLAKADIVLDVGAVYDPAFFYIPYRVRRKFGNPGKILDPVQ